MQRSGGKAARKARKQAAKHASLVGKAVAPVQGGTDPGSQPDISTPSEQRSEQAGVAASREDGGHSCGAEEPSGWQFDSVDFEGLGGSAQSNLRTREPESLPSATEASGWQFDTSDFEGLGLSLAASNGESASLAGRQGGEGDEGSGWQYDSLDFDALGLSAAENASTENPGSAVGLRVESSEAQSGSEEEGLERASPLHCCWAALLEKHFLRGLSESALRMVDLSRDLLLTLEEASRVVPAAKAAGLASSCVASFSQRRPASFCEMRLICCGQGFRTA